MASDVTMPRLSDSMEEGTVLKWLVEEGGEVKRGEPLVEIETDKANMTYESDTDGTLIDVVAQEGDTLAIGEVIARIGDPSEAGGNGKPAAKEEEPAEEEPAEEEAEAPEASDEEAAQKEEEKEEQPVAGAAEGGGETESGGTATKTRAPSGNGAGEAERVKASPVARRMARELGVELARLEGSGPGGRIVKADVQAAAEGDGAGVEAPAREEERAPAVAEEREPEPQRTEAGAKGEAEVQELTRLQQTVARRMAESKATAPDFSISLTVDMTQAVELRKRLKEVADPAPSFNDMVVKAAAIALTEHPRVNGAYRDGKFELY
jgi:pyruvate dehydrogenase E2 component (dihydrolipoamide acetyltransferase)